MTNHPAHRMSWGLGREWRLAAGLVAAALASPAAAAPGQLLLAVGWIFLQLVSPKTDKVMEIEYTWILRQGKIFRKFR